MRIAASLTVALTVLGCHSTPGEADGQTPLVIENITLVDCLTGLQRPHLTIVVEGERIISIGADSGVRPQGARVIDGTGKWVVPGFIDVHVHDASDPYLRDLLAWGVTAVHLMPNHPPAEPALRERESQAAQATVPRLQLTEMFAGAFPDNLFPGVYQFIQPGTQEQARRSVRDSHARGYRQIKIIQDDSFQWSGETYRVHMIPQPVFDALVAEARALHMRVYVHATDREVVRAALAAGVDAFMHGAMDGVAGADEWRAMAAAKCVWTPTIHALLCFGDQRSYARRVLADERFTALLEERERAQWSGMANSADPIILPPTAFLVQNTARYVATVQSNTRRAQDAGVAVAVGTDGGPGGISTHIELELLQASGLTPTEVLRAATHGGALALGRQAELGSIEVGKLADMVVLNADPTIDIRNCREIEWVIKGGTVHRSRELALEH